MHSSSSSPPSLEKVGVLGGLPPNKRAYEEDEEKYLPPPKRRMGVLFNFDAHKLYALDEVEKTIVLFSSQRHNVYKPENNMSGDFCVAIREVVDALKANEMTHMHISASINEDGNLKVLLGSPCGVFILQFVQLDGTALIYGKSFRYPKYHGLLRRSPNGILSILMPKNIYNVLLPTIRTFIATSLESYHRTKEPQEEGEKEKEKEK